MQGYVWVETGIIVNQELEKYFKPCGYVPVRYTLGLWRHAHNDTLFALVIDDFAIKYTLQQDVNHLLETLRDK